MGWTVQTRARSRALGMCTAMHTEDMRTAMCLKPSRHRFQLLENSIIVTGLSSFLSQILNSIAQSA